MILPADIRSDVRPAERCSAQLGAPVGRCDLPPQHDSLHRSGAMLWSVTGYAATQYGIVCDEFGNTAEPNEALALRMRHDRERREMERRHASEWAVRRGNQAATAS